MHLLKAKQGGLATLAFCALRPMHFESRDHYTSPSVVNAIEAGFLGRRRAVPARDPKEFTP